MNDRVHLLLDGDLSDNETVEFLRSLISDGDARSAFREQLKLQGALYRNEGFGGMSSGEEMEMLSRVGSAIGVTATVPFTRRIGNAVWGMVAGALIVGAGLGYTGHELFGGPPENTTATVTQPVTPAATPVARPCNCDSVAAAAVSAHQDSLSRAAQATPARKAAAKPKRRKIQIGAVTGLRPSTESKHGQR